jgi:preprotein translocase subunit Sss1
MQGGNQLPRSNQKRLDKVRRIREAMASGSSVLVNKEKAENDEYAKIMVVDGEVLVGPDRRASKGQASSRDEDD